MDNILDEKEKAPEDPLKVDSMEAEVPWRKLKEAGDKLFDNTKAATKETVAATEEYKRIIVEASNQLFENVKNTAQGAIESQKCDTANKKEEMIFKSGDSLQQVVNVVNEAAMALNDKNRTIRESSIPEVLAATLGAGVGGSISFAALYGLGTVGLSGPAIMSGLATAGEGVSLLLGGAISPAVAGLFVLAAPIAVLSAGGVALASSAKRKQLKQEKERLYKEALLKHEAIIQALKDESEANKERLDYLHSLNILLQRAIEDLQKDLGIAA